MREESLMDDPRLDAMAALAAVAQRLDRRERQNRRSRRAALAALSLLAALCALTWGRPGPVAAQQVEDRNDATALVGDRLKLSREGLPILLMTLAKGAPVT